MDKTAGDSASAVDHAGRAGASLEQINSIIARMAEMNTQVATAADEQATVAEDINRNVTGVKEISEQVVDATMGNRDEIIAALFTVQEIDMLMSQFKVTHKPEQTDEDALAFWNDGFLVGVPSIDRQHQRLFALMNTAYREYRNDATDADLDRTLGELVDFARQHLTDEEALMQQAEYSGLEAHKRVHQQLLKDMDAHVSRYQQTRGEDELLELLFFLKGWLIDHIYRVDKHYSDDLVAAGIR